MRICSAYLQWCHPQVMTLAIGDGVNDVEMVRTSHVSVGIRGGESQLAAQVIGGHQR